MASLEKANTTFALNLFEQLNKDNKTGNVFYSPVSISSALAMVFLGAKGSTATQMSKVLQLHTHKEDIHAGFSELIGALQEKDEFCSLSLANRLYGEKSFEFVEKFLEDTNKLYMAELETVDFKTDADAARLNINQWVEDNTQGKIKDLLGEDALTSDSKLVLVNAIYFKGIWNKTFDEKETKEVEFKLSKNVSKPVQMMHQEEHFSYAFHPLEGLHVLELPYKGYNLSMVILLPDSIADEGTGLEMLEQKLNYDNFDKWTSNQALGNVKVKVGLPKFRLEETYDLVDHLKDLGMRHAFDKDKVDFSGMSPSPHLVVSKVVHKSFVEVSEEATEAAAATGVTMTLLTCYLPSPPRIFYADHPFLFFIRHNPTKSIVFCGRYSSP